MSPLLWAAIVVIVPVYCDLPKVFLVKVIVPTYTKTVKKYEELVTTLCTKKVRRARDFDDLPIKTKANVQKTLKELTSLAHKVCFDANKFMKKSRDAENMDSHKTEAIQAKLRGMDTKKSQLKSAKNLAKDKLRQTKVNRVELEDKLQLKREELDETNRKMEQSRCRKKRSKKEGKKKKKKAPMDSAKETKDNLKTATGMKAVRCQFDRILRKQKEALQKEVNNLTRLVKEAKKAESNADRTVTDDRKKLEQARKEISKVDSNKETWKINTSSASAELSKSKKLIDNIRVLQGHLQNVHDGITKDVKVIDRDLPVIVLSMKKINIALMGFNIKGEGKLSLPDLKKLETFADQAEKDNARMKAEAKQ